MKKRVLLVVLAALIGIHIAMPFETKAEPHMNYEGPFEFSVETLYRAGDWGYYLTDANQIVIHQYYGSAETVGKKWLYWTTAFPSASKN